jgi:very-short-patch-repair endonuclease
MPFCPLCLSVGDLKEKTYIRVKHNASCPLVGFSAEYRFHPARKYRLDWADPIHKIAVEAHGSVWKQGRHTRGQGFLNDREKMNLAQSMGWRVIEVSTEQVTDGTLLKRLEIMQ